MKYAPGDKVYILKQTVWKSRKVPGKIEFVVIGPVEIKEVRTDFDECPCEYEITFPAIKDQTILGTHQNECNMFSTLRDAERVKDEREHEEVE